MFKLMLLLSVVALLSMSGSVLATDHWWHGGTSADVNDAANWTDRNAATVTSPQGGDIVRIGGSWGSEDLNLNGVLDAGEDLNGNDVIDDPVPTNVIGYGGYFGTYGDPPVVGGGLDLAVDPVLSETYVSGNGDENGGWWFVLNAPNILTLEDGALLIMERDNCNLRNGGRLEVKGRSDEYETNGPSLIVAKQFRIAENGSVAEAKDETSQLIVSGTGYMQVDPWLPAGTGAAFMIGTSEDPGTMPRGELIIEDSGRVEIIEDGNAEMFLYFGNADPSVNQIIIRDNGELSLYGDPASMGRVSTDNTIENASVVSLQFLIDNELIINDQDGTIEATGTGPTVVKATGITGINDEPSATPMRYALMQNYPNPFNPSTKISYSLPYQTKVRINVYDLLGRKVAELINEEKSAGTYEVNFEAKNLSGGVYIYQLEYSGQVISKKMLLIK